VTDKKPVCCNSVLKGKVTDLTMHLTQGCLTNLWVIRCMCQYSSRLYVGKFEIRHIDIDDSFQKPECVNVFISARVVDKWDLKPGIDCDQKCFKDSRELVSRGDQVDIMTSQCLKMEIDVCKILLCEFSPHPLMADLIVLAEPASHGASGKKDGP